jgi:hypothetical protein
MAPGKSAGFRPRELRRRVILPARLHHGTSWSDACILNISSRGMLVHSARPIARDSEVEIHRGGRVIVARVIWRDGGRTGLQADERLPVEDMMILGPSPSLRLIAPASERRSRLRPQDHSRLRGRAIEFAGIAAIAVSLASAGLVMIEAAFARPLALIAAALGS